MGKATAWRVALLPPLFIAVSLSFFVLLRVLPTDDIADIVAGRPASPAQKQALRDHYGLDDPVYQQYLTWLRDFGQGDFGETYAGGKSVRGELAHRLPSSIEIVVLSGATSAMLGVGFASLTVYSRWRSLGTGIAALLAAFTSIPEFIALSLLIVLPSLWWKYAPPIGYHAIYGQPSTNVRLFFPAALVIAVAGAGRATNAALASLSRSGEAGGNIKTALVAFGHAVMGCLPLVVGASIVFEYLFSVEGVGLFLLAAVRSRDVPVVQLLSTVIVFATLALAILCPPKAAGPAHVGVRSSQISRTLVMIGLVLITLFVLSGVFGPFLSPHSPSAISVSESSQSPSWAHPFGTDTFGRDTFSRLLFASRGTLKFVSVVVFLGSLPGAIIGVIIAKFAPRAATGVRRFTTAWSMISLLVLMLAAVAAYGPGLNVIGAVVTVYAFVAGLETMSDAALRREHVTTGWFRSLTVRDASGVAWLVCQTAIVAVLALSVVDFLGFGTAPSASAWGREYGRALSVSGGHAYGWSFPAAMIIGTAFGFALVAAAVGDSLDPRANAQERVPRG